jgi:hypothetical protein
MVDPSLPDLILYGRAECGLCIEARELINAVLAERASTGVPTPTFVEHDIDDDANLQRAFFDRIPVVELGDRRIETVISVAKLRRLLREALDTAALDEGHVPIGTPSAT